MAKKAKSATIRSNQVKYKAVGKLPLYTQGGEQIMTNLVDVEVSQDVNWFKVYMANLAGILDVVGNQKMTVFGYILENINRGDNMFLGSIRETVSNLEEKGKPVSHKTVADTFKLLKETGFWAQVRPGNYIVNEKIAMYGSTMKRGFLMMQFKEAESKEQAGQTSLFDKQREAS
ncbi:replication/maintenance protein RepL [Tunicatimonas pelagia]|uniref:replication/maintenance protein RepL n=1 Tax=Tunicatimonas pelagia TaxID=931531 RepID=UPI0026659DCE|nr:replication/maintenance protein RepL [Tunicatimonas pelagia]WKN46526.1 replication/maintenance protein RepL [Tunicatimonas pelagia]